MQPRAIGKLSDEELIGLTLENHPRVFSYLVDRYKGMVFTLSSRIVRNPLDAEEVAQDTFVKAFRALDTFRFDCKFSTWLYRICFNTAMSKARLGVQPAYSIDDRMAIPHDAPNAMDALAAEDRSRYLNMALALLEGEESAILTLYYIEGNSIKEIESITGLTESNVKVKLHRARKKLYLLLEQVLKKEVSEIL
jgi:RNA polymerase sigma-70 factor (ECF subfamily)